MGTAGRRHSTSTRRGVAVLVLVTLLAGTELGPRSTRAATDVPPEETVLEWNAIAENVVTASGAFQNEGLVYMAYASAAVYDAVVAITGGYEPLGRLLDAPADASVDCAVLQAAYSTLDHYLGANESLATRLAEQRSSSLARLGGCTADSGAGLSLGQAAADHVIERRAGDGLTTPIGTTSPVPTPTPAPGVWRLTPPGFAAPQTPWVADVAPFVLRAADQFHPDPPPSLGSPEWADAVAELVRSGSAVGSDRTAAMTTTARFWTANVIRQYNRMGRDLAAGRGAVEAARLLAMVNVVGADAQISVMRAKYHHLFWRPVTAVDPTSVTNDGFGPIPGYDDGNGSTIERPGWRPLLTTPNHPEYPAAHGSVTSAMAEVVVDFTESNRAPVAIHGFDPAGPSGNLDAVRVFETATALRQEIIDARVWGGLHYRFSGVAGVVLGRQVAKYDLAHAFRPTN